MSYTLIAPSLHPVDAEMTRAATSAELGLPEIPRSMEPSGFAVGGENDTETIRGLTELNGQSVERYSIQAQTTRGFQESPFRDETRGNADFQVTNARTGATVALSDLSGEMISRYGFYQGPGSPYRSAPEDIIRTFGDLAEKAGGEAEIKRIVAEVDAYHSAAEAMSRATTGWEGRPTQSGTAATSRPDGGTRRSPDVRGR